MDPNDLSGSSFDAIPVFTNITGSDDAEETPHLRGLEEFISELNKATDNILRSGRQRYDKVTALVTCWPDSLSDRKHIRESAQDLCDVFKVQYHFDVNDGPYEIPETDSHPALQQKLLESLDKVAIDKPPEENRDQTNLFILYYGGHAVEKDNMMEWRPAAHAETTASVRWTSLLDIFTDINCDLLFLFDCCYSSQVVDYGRVFNQRCEVLCASNRDVRASEEKGHSFTKALARELRSEAEISRGCEIKRLHSLLNLESNQQVYNLKVSPYWNTFTRRPKTSIRITPLGDNQANLAASSSTGQDLADLPDTQVLFKVTLKNPDVRPTLDEWKEFLNQCPGNIRSIDWVAVRESHVHELFKTHSS